LAELTSCDQSPQTAVTSNLSFVFLALCYVTIWGYIPRARHSMICFKSTDLLSQREEKSLDLPFFCIENN